MTSRTVAILDPLTGITHNVQLMPVVASIATLSGVERWLIFLDGCQLAAVCSHVDTCKALCSQPMKLEEVSLE